MITLKITNQNKTIQLTTHDPIKIRPITTQAYKLKKQLQHKQQQQKQNNKPRLNYNSKHYLKKYIKMQV